METRRSIPTAVVTLLVIAFLFAPLMIVVLFSFHSTNGLTLPFEGFSFRWYREVLDDPSVRDGLMTSLRVGLSSAVLTFVLGTAAAYGVSRSSSRLKTLYGGLFVTPLAMPALIFGIALLSFFAYRDVSLSVTTVIIAHTIFVMPLFFVVATTALSRIEGAQLEAAADLGSTPWHTFWHVVFMQILPVLLAGAAMAFVISFDEFIITFFVIGNESTLPMVIFSRLRRTIDPSINAISSLLLAVNLIMWLIAVIYSVRAEGRRLQDIRQQNALKNQELAL